MWPRGNTPARAPPRHEARVSRAREGGWCTDYVCTEASARLRFQGDGDLCLSRGTTWCLETGFEKKYLPHKGSIKFRFWILVFFFRSRVHGVSTCVLRRRQLHSTYTRTYSSRRNLHSLTLTLTLQPLPCNPYYLTSTLTHTSLRTFVREACSRRFRAKLPQVSSTGTIGTTFPTRKVVEFGKNQALEVSLFRPSVKSNPTEC